MIAPGMVPFGYEETAEDCARRAAWERKQADEVRGHPYGDVIANIHERVARAYESLRETKLLTARKRCAL